MKKEVIEKLASLSTAAFGLVAALAWNNAIQSLFQEGAPLGFLAKSGPWGYALVVTILAVLVTIYIGKASQKAQNLEFRRRKKEEKQIEKQK